MIAGACGAPQPAIPTRSGGTTGAVKVVAPQADVVLVIGSKNSSNSNRLAELSAELGTPAHLVDDETSVDPAWLDGASTVGLTSGASAPDWLVHRMLGWLAERGFDRHQRLDAGATRIGPRRLSLQSPDTSG